MRPGGAGADRSKAVAGKPKKAAKPALLSGDNPQIAKGYGDAPVQAWIATSPFQPGAAAIQACTGASP